jgi:import inner membrane translocase subunit TIM22
MNPTGITAVFSGTECVVEKLRGKHDGNNAIYAGCATGAALAARSGPEAMALGCAGFAAFSAAIDYFMGEHADDSDD